MKLLSIFALSLSLFLQAAAFANENEESVNADDGKDPRTVCANAVAKCQEHPPKSNKSCSMAKISECKGVDSISD